MRNTICFAVGTVYCQPQFKYIDSAYSVIQLIS